ncbi:MAG: GNAT family N-acetyltransferase [Clostridia bacterium]|nr:GNAT family N-acetyltransferase [Clostridia bacterium]
MTRIENSAQFNEIVKNFRSKYGKVLSNCFLMPSEIDGLASNNSLFVAEYPGWLLIICDREGYSNLYYYTDGISSTDCVGEFLNSLENREVYLDIVTRSGRGDNDTPSRLIADGIAEKYKSYQRMQLPVKNIDYDSLVISVAEGYSLSDDYCVPEEFNKLWKMSLDEKSTPLPTDSEIKSLCDDGCLYSTIDSEGNLTGVLMLTVSSKQALLQHLAVSPLHRRKGLAFTLFQRSFLAARDKELTMLKLWVDRENMSAIALYDRTGFVTDGMICDQLYMKGK